MPRPRPGRRRAVSTLFLVLLVMLVLFIWGTAQHFMGASIRRRVRIAEGARRALIRAETAVREAEGYVAIHANEPGPRGKFVPGSLGYELRSLEPGQLVQYEIEPELARDWGQGDGPVQWGQDDDAEVVLLAYLKGTSETESEFEEECDDLLGKLRDFAVKWSQVPG